jgi:hypothetical protein
VLLKNLPIEATHTTKVLGTKGKNALVADSGSVRAAGAAVANFDYRYAVNRTTMGPGSGYPDVVKQTGVTFNWPIRTQKHDYPGWISDTQSTTPLRFAGTAQRGGLSTYVFTATMPAAPVTDPATLKQLPAGLPKATLIALAGGLGLGSSELGLLQQALPSQPDPVPFNYTYAMTATFWVQPDTGEVVDLQERETRTLGLKIGSQIAPVTPIMDISYSSSPSQLAVAAKDARHDADLVTLVYSTLPIALGATGAALLIVGAVGLVVFRRRSGGGAHSPTEPVLSRHGFDAASL